jgi:Flp pilus assembly protein TadD
MNIKTRQFLVFNRLPIAIVLIILGFIIGFNATWWIAWIPMLIAVLMVVAHFLIGPMSLIQHFIENGDIEGAQKLLGKVKYPNLLYKPVRSSYHMLQANVHTMTEDLDKAESSLRKSLEDGITDKSFEGTAYLQLGAIAQRKGNTKEAYEQIRKALQLGLPDKDNEASAYLQLSAICMQRRDFRASKNYFSKARSCKPTNAQILDQIKEMEKYIARMPG